MGESVAFDEGMRGSQVGGETQTKDKDLTSDKKSKTCVSIVLSKPGEIILIQNGATVSGFITLCQQV